MSHPAYLLRGNEFLAEEALQKIRAESRVDPLSEVAFDSDAPGVEIVTALNTTSLLGGRRMVIVRAAHELKKDQAQPLLDYLESPSPDSLLVLIGAGRTKFDDLVKRVGAVVTLEAPKGRRLVAWTRERARDHRLQLWGLSFATSTERCRNLGPRWARTHASGVNRCERLSLDLLTSGCTCSPTQWAIVAWPSR
jgi:DNA polymerase III delta subunit